MSDKYTSYTRAIVRAVRPITEEALADREDMSEWMASVLKGEPPPAPKNRRALRRDEDVAIKLFRGLTEIGGTVASLENIPKLASHSPPKRTGVEKSAYLQLMVETYLSEIYILKERCDRYRSTVVRIYRRDERATQIKKRLDQVGELTAESFKSIVNTRGAHVHEARFNDNELERLRTLALLAPSNDALGWIERSAFRATKASKVGWMNENNEAMRKFLDLYFKAIASVVLTPTSDVRFPKVVGMNPNEQMHK